MGGALWNLPRGRTAGLAALSSSTFATSEGLGYSGNVDHERVRESGNGNAGRSGKDLGIGWAGQGGDPGMMSIRVKQSIQR